jgi:hypothetical protein
MCHIFLYLALRSRYRTAYYLIIGVKIISKISSDTTQVKLKPFLCLCQYGLCGKKSLAITTNYEIFKTAVNKHMHLNVHIIQLPGVNSSKH